VEEAGVELWLERFGNPAMREAYTRYTVRRTDFLALLLKYRRELERAYAQPVGDEDKRIAKARLFLALKDEYQVLKANWGGYAGYDRFFAEPLSNAHLASIATYNDYVPAFRALLRSEKNFAAFYRKVGGLAKLDKAGRQRALKLIDVAAPAGTFMVQRTSGGLR
jgi:predicted aminopeptidase